MKLCFRIYLHLVALDIQILFKGGKLYQLESHIPVLNFHFLHIELTQPPLSAMNLYHYSLLLTKTCILLSTLSTAYQQYDTPQERREQVYLY